MKITYEDLRLVSEEFEYKTTAPIELITSSLAICDNHTELGQRLLIGGYISFLICKN